MEVHPARQKISAAAPAADRTERSAKIKPRLDSYLESLIGIGFLIPDYITLHAVSWLLGIYFCVKSAESQGIPVQKTLNALLCLFLFGVLGARAYYCIQHLDFFMDHPGEILAFWKGGFASYGGFIGGTAAGMIYLKLAGVPLGRFADCCAPFVALGLFLTRLGCFMNGCCFGKLTDLPWAVRFPRGSGPYIQQLFYGQISGRESLALPVHPTQLYDAAVGLTLFLLLTAARRHSAMEGRLALSLATVYSMARFCVEFFRGDISRGFAGMLSLPQVFSLSLGAVTGVFLLAKTRRRRCGAAAS